MARIAGNTTSELDHYVESNFVIGPVAEKAFNEDSPHQDEIERGPCESSNKLHPVLLIDQLMLARPSVQGSVLMSIL